MEALRRLDESNEKLKGQAVRQMNRNENHSRRVEPPQAGGELSAGMTREMHVPLGLINGDIEILKSY